MNKTAFELYGRQCQPGWDKIINPLLERLLDLGGTPLQIKEKFGTLRFYYSLPSSVENDEHKSFRELVNDAETQSGITCELCGCKGSLITDPSWYRVRCKNHNGE